LQKQMQVCNAWAGQKQKTGIRTVRGEGCARELEQLGANLDGKDSLVREDLWDLVDEDEIRGLGGGLLLVV
jgi:hypothetical protein